MARTLSRLLALVVLGGCAADGSQDMPLRFDAVFPEQSRIELEEDMADPIQAITALSVTESGRLIVVDGPAGKVRVFDAAGSVQAVLGRPGEGPGELDAPRWAAAGPDDAIRVVQQGSPRITVYRDQDSVEVAELPGHYGHWIQPIGDEWAVGASSMEARYATLSSDLTQTLAMFEPVSTMVRETPFWIFLAVDRATVADGAIVVNNSFAPTLRRFDATGRLLAEVDVAPENWIPPSSPPIDRIRNPGDGQIIEDWSKTFTVVTGLAARSDSLVFVQFGRHNPGHRTRGGSRTNTWTW